MTYSKQLESTSCATAVAEKNLRVLKNLPLFSQNKDFLHFSMKQIWTIKFQQCTVFAMFVKKSSIVRFEQYFAALWVLRKHTSKK